MSKEDGEFNAYDYWDDIDKLIERLKKAQATQEKIRRLEKERLKREKLKQKPVDQNMINAMNLMGLKEGFTKDDVRKAYRRLVKIHHPDRGGLEENFKKLKKAYDYVMKRLG